MAAAAAQINANSPRLQRQAWLQMPAHQTAAVRRSWAQFKYVAHVDGISCSSRYEKLLSLGSLVVKEESGYRWALRGSWHSWADPAGGCNCPRLHGVPPWLQRRARWAPALPPTLTPAAALQPTGRSSTGCSSPTSTTCPSGGAAPRRRCRCWAGRRSTTRRRARSPRPGRSWSRSGRRAGGLVAAASCPTRPAARSRPP